MASLKIRDLFDLVSSEVSNPDKHIEKVFDWVHGRRLELAKWLLAVSLAVSAPVLLAYFKGDLTGTISPWWVIVAVFLAVLLAVSGLVVLLRTGRLHRTYLVTQSLLGRIQQIAPFISRYREEGRE